MNIADFCKKFEESDNTRRNRANCLKKFVEYIEPNCNANTADIQTVLKDVTEDRLIAYVDSKDWSIGTKSTTIGSLKKSLSVLLEREFNVSSKLKEYTAAVQMQRGQNKPTAKMMENRHVSWNGLIEYEKQLRETKYGSPQHALVALRVFAFPRRDSDVQSMIVSENSIPGKNTLVLSDPIVLEYHDHKTKQYHPPLIFKLSEDDPRIKVAPQLPLLGQILREYVTKNNLMGKPLFENVPSLWKRVMTHAFDVDTMGIQECRRLFVQHICDQRLDKNARDMIAEMCGHNLVQQLAYDVIVETPQRDEVHEECVALLEELHGTVDDHETRIQKLESIIFRLMNKKTNL